MLRVLSSQIFITIECEQQPQAVWVSYSPDRPTTIMKEIQFFIETFTSKYKGYGMNILIINTGSSSLKYQLFDMDQTKSMVGGVVERIGEPQGVMTHKDFTGSENGGFDFSAH